MPARKMRVELYDSDGNRYTVAFEGQITREKALQLFELVELLGGVPSNETSGGTVIDEVNRSGSKYDRVRVIIQKHFPLVWFSSREVQTVYEQELKEPISLSTVATYLARLVTKHLLDKTGAANNLKYRRALALPQPILKQQTRH